MAPLFVIVFLAAVVGIFKPYISGWTRKYFAIAAGVSFILIGVFAPKSDNSTSQPAPSAKNGAPEPAAAGNAPADAETVPGSDWSYSEDKDAMRGTTTRFAILKSKNEVDLDFPYGTVSGQLTIRQRPEDGLNVIFEVEKGQILCHGYGRSYVSAKFDDGPIRTYPCNDASDGSSEVAFLSNERDFLKRIQSAKQTIIEAEFYQQGRQQFIFHTADLNWK